MNLYAKVYATFILPITLGLLFTIFSINSLLEEQQKLITNQVQIEIDHIQQRFDQILLNTQRDLNIISKSNDIEKALVINDNHTLSQWGETFLNKLYSTIIFANENNTIVSRASDPFRFGDKLEASLLEKLSNTDEYQGIHVIDDKEILFFSKKIKSYASEPRGTIILGITIDRNFLQTISNKNDFVIKYHSINQSDIYSSKIKTLESEVPLKSGIINIDEKNHFMIQTQYNKELEELKNFKFNILTFSILMAFVIVFLLYFILTNFLRPYKRIYMLLLDFVNNKIDFNHLKMASKNISRNTKTKEIYQMSRAINKVSKKALKNENELKKISYTDQLTKVLNRRKLDEILLKESYEANRYHKKLSIIIIDIDYFKKINDTYGHPIGDKILKQFSARVSEDLRTSDFFGRWGGEEFLVICPSTDIQGAYALATKLQAFIKSKPFANDLKVTASFGVGEILKNESFYNLISRTDEALYKAKNNGRDQIEKADQTHIDDNPTNQF